MNGRPFRVGISPWLRRADGSVDLEELGLEDLERRDDVAWKILDEDREVVGPAALAGLDAIILEMQDLDASSLSGVTDLRHVARYGAGLDSVDLDACTAAGIIVTNAPDGVRRPMAVANLAFILAAALRLVEKDRLTREGGWDAGNRLLGMGLTGRTLGMVGVGNIGAETLRLAAPLEMEVLGHDPFLGEARLRERGAEPVGLDELLARSDVVVLGVPLGPATRHLVGERELRRMKRTAYLVNTTRGAVVDEAALVRALREGWIAGAALDVFEEEPIDAASPLLEMPNVTLAPHSLGSTDECFQLIGKSVVRALLDVHAGRQPRWLVNPAVLEHPRVAGRLAPREEEANT